MPRILQAGCQGLLALGLCTILHAQEVEYKHIETDTLIDQPQNYWSRGIAFKDAPAEVPEKGTTRIDKERYHPCTLEVVGEVFVTPDLADKLTEEMIGREFLFQGTVLTRKKFSLFSLGTKEDYAIVLNGAEASVVEDAGQMQSMAGSLLSSTGAVANVSIRRMKEIADRAQAALLSLARENELEPAALFKPGSPARERLRSAVRRSIRQVEDAHETTANEIMAGVIFALLAEQYASGQPSASAVTEPPPASPTPEAPAPRPGTNTMEEFSVEPPSEEAPESDSGGPTLETLDVPDPAADDIPTPDAPQPADAPTALPTGRVDNATTGAPAPDDTEDPNAPEAP